MSEAAAQAAGTTPAASQTPVQSTAQAQVQTPPPAPRAAGEEYKDMSPDAFKARLQAERETAQRQVLKELGVESPDAVKAALGKLKQLEDEKLSESERSKKAIDELTPKARRAETLEGTIKRYLDAEEKAIPEAKRELLDLAPKDPEARLDWIASAKLKGLFAVEAPKSQTATGEAKDPKPATTMGAPGPTAPKAAGTLTPYETHKALLDSGQTIRAAAYRARNAKAIEASKPK